MSNDLFGRPVLPVPAEHAAGPARPYLWPTLARATPEARRPAALRLIHFELLLDNRLPLEVVQHTPMATYWQQIYFNHPEYVTLEVVDFKHMARATEAGYQAARAYFKTKPYNFRPKSTDLTKLRKNFNLFVATETEWEQVADNVAFRDMCVHNDVFRIRWAPKKDFSSYRP